MYQYSDFDRQFVHLRAAQYRDQLTRWQAGTLGDDEFKPLRLQNGWYVQRFAPMLRVAVPYGEISSPQLRVLAKIARDFDHKEEHDVSKANAGLSEVPTLPDRCGHFTTRQNVQYNWIPLSRSADVMDLLASVGLRLLRNVDGDLGFQVRVGGGMGRTPIIGSVVREFLPWNQILNYLEAVVRAYNRFGRRDNIYKARIKILVKAEGQAFTDQVEAEYQDILEKDGAPHTISQAELDRVSAFFVPPQLNCDRKSADAKIAHILKAAAEDDLEFSRWLQQNVKPHQNPDLRAVTLSFKRFGQAPGDATAEQLERAAELAERFSAGEARVTHEQNLLLPWVRCDQLPELWREARRLGLAKPNIGLLTDMIACPGGDFCDLANARSLPLAQAILGRYKDLDELHDLGEIDLHISGCINSCGHHHSGHIGILGVDKDGQEWYQVTLGGSDGTRLSGDATPGKVIGPSFAASEVPDVIEALLDTYRAQRTGQETFVNTLRRTGADPFKTAANAVRTSTARAAA
ncbi:MAG: nitrite/sulfite reductase [Hydrogenophaga sp.]